MEEKELFNSGTSKKSIRWSIIGFIFFTTIATGLTLNTEDKDGFAIGLISFFAAFGIGSLGSLLFLKQIILTNHRLVFNWKFLPKNREYMLTEIASINEEPYEVKSQHDSTEFEIQKGRLAKIKLKNEQKILQFNSFEVENYYVLINHLKQLTTKMPKNFVGDVNEYGKFEQRIYGNDGKFWFYFILAITGLLIYGFISQLYVG